MDTCRVGSRGEKEGRRVPGRGGQRQTGTGVRDRDKRGKEKKRRPRETADRAPETRGERNRVREETEEVEG